MAQKYLVSGTLQHGVVVEPAKDGKPAVTRVDVYHDGDEFETEDPALERELRRSKSILLPEEYAALAAGEGNAAPLQQLAAERQALSDENAALKARLAELEAAQAASKQSDSAKGK